ncbi:MAG TPA: acetyl-CoA hydrolase/transferase family protein [Spirochaetes bacterium]|nr:acetyl-CoA hydrolase/transferase family protein [Spirochaetota bacterium]
MRRQGRIETISPDEAVKVVRSGNRVVTGHAAGEPRLLVDALAKRAGELRDVEVIQLLTLGDGVFCRPEHSASFRHNGLFTSKTTRQAMAEGRAHLTPCFFHRVPSLFRDGDLPLDVALVTVTPPDDNGNMSLGVAVDYTLEAVKQARTVIAEVNPNMPHTGGGSLVHVNDIHGFVESDTPLYQTENGTGGEVEKAIGAHIAGLIDDGCCLQIGIGAIPEAVLDCLGNFRDMGIHSEMISDGVMKLAEKGVLTGAMKKINRGKIVFTFVVGSGAFYRWLDRNPLVEAYAVDYTNDPCVIGQNDNVVSINSALSVDLLGQVCSEAVGVKQYSGVGGQVDFVRGAARSRGGKSIIALPSTARGHSRIVAALAPGQPVTTSRNDVDWIVTEHGAACLRGKTVHQRARALIEIAAPPFREGLRREFREVYGYGL